jgi:DNA primase
VKIIVILPQYPHTLVISRSTIDKVFEAARVEEVIGDFVQLKKSGTNFKGLSPFTDERTPSFMVSPVKQIWKDFSSGKGGNVVAFVMEHEHYTYPEAIKYLARRYGIEVEETEQTDEQKEKASERESLYLVSEYARDFFVKSLWEAEEGKAIAHTYFKERGFTDATIREFELGYSPAGWDSFTASALKQGYQLEFLEKTGLTVVKEDKQFDRFRGRVIFPIKSLSGRVLGFGGRILGSDKKAAKYLNSPESDIYHKSKVLYGIFKAKQHIAREDNCFLVEGYTDVIQFYQRGIRNVVSSSGTALTPDQIRLISRLTKNITLLFDGDAAGLRASLRGVDLILEQGVNVRICAFPEGEDPDSFARKNQLEEVIDYLKENTRDFISFKASLLASDAKNDPLKKAETIHDMVLSISRIPDVIKQELYIKECARIMDISQEVLFNTLAQLLQKEKREASRKRPEQKQAGLEVVAPSAGRVKPVDKQYELERKIIQLLLLYGAEEAVFEELLLETDEDGEITFKPESRQSKVYEKIYLDLQEDEIEFTNVEFKELYDTLVHKLINAGQLEVQAVINQLDTHKAATLTSLIMEDEREPLHQWERKEIFVKSKKEQIPQLVSETILNLRRELIVKKIRELSEELKEDDPEKKLSALQSINDYNELKKMLSEKLRRVL